MNNMRKSVSGFTIVELLIVIVVIAVLAAVTTVAYNGLQTRAQNAKIASDISILQKAALAAREAKAKPLLGVVSYNCGNGGESACCIGQYSDLSSSTVAPRCWAAWQNYQQTIGEASGIDLANMTDPWGQPYIFEVVESANDCRQDKIYAVKPPLKGWGSTRLGTVTLPYSVYSGCS